MCSTPTPLASKVHTLSLSSFLGFIYCITPEMIKCPEFVIHLAYGKVSGGGWWLVCIYWLCSET